MYCYTYEPQFIEWDMFDSQLSNQGLIRDNLINWKFIIFYWGFSVEAVIKEIIKGKLPEFYIFLNGTL